MEDIIRIRYNFGGKWDDSGKYVGGDSFDQARYDIDMFGFWNVKGFFRDTLKMRASRMWFKMDATSTRGEQIIEILSDVEVVRLTEVQRDFDFTDIYGVEVGDNVASKAELRRRLDEDLKKHSSFVLSQWSRCEIAEENWSEDSQDNDIGGDSESSDEEQDNVVVVEEPAGVEVEEGAGVEVQEGAGVNVEEQADVEVEEPAGVEVEEGAGVEVEEGAGVNVEEGAGVNVEEQADVEIEEPAGVEVEEGAGAEVEEGAGVNVEEPAGVEAEVRVEGPAEVRVEGQAEVRVEGQAEVRVEEPAEVRVEETNYLVEDGSEDEVILGDTELKHVKDSDDDDGIEYPFFSRDYLVDGKLVLDKGMKFQSVAQYRRALKDWSVSNGADYRFVKNTRERVTVVCTKDCGFRVHASLIDEEGVFQIKTWYPQHQCARDWNNCLVKSRYICERFLEDIRDNPTWPVVAFHQTVQKKLGVEVTMKQCYRAKQRALQIINGDATAQYKRLRDYGNAIITTCRGSTVKICTEDRSPGWVKEQNSTALHPAMVPLPAVPQFKYMYVCFGAQKAAFSTGLRTFVGLDGCFLKGVMGGQLLSAVAKDGNETMYPLAVAIVDAEDKKSWHWFLDCFINDFGHPRENNIVFMSDRQKGLQEAINALMPGVEHRMCVKHMYENFKATFKGQEFKELFWAAASTGSIAKWTNCLEKMKKLPNGEEAVKYLMKEDPRSWSKSHFSTHSKTDLIVNNISEAFNSSIVAGRELPILTMMEWIRRRLMKKIHVKRAKMEKYKGAICPSIVKILDRAKIAAANCFATPSGNKKFEIDCFGSTAVVDVAAKLCTCRMWELTGIPCKHAVAGIHACRLRPEDFVDVCYSKETYMKVYSHFILPLPSREEWTVTDAPDVHPPLIRKPAGRPKRKRRRQIGEGKGDEAKISRVGGDVRCGNCHQIGHNVRGCKAAVTGESPWQRRKRIAREKEQAAKASTRVPEAASQPSSSSPMKKYQARRRTRQSTDA